jgi:hypothetical protein
LFAGHDMPGPLAHIEVLHSTLASAHLTLNLFAGGAADAGSRGAEPAVSSSGAAPNWAAQQMVRM